MGKSGRGSKILNAICQWHIAATSSKTGGYHNLVFAENGMQTSLVTRSKKKKSPKGGFFFSGKRARLEDLKCNMSVVDQLVGANAHIGPIANATLSGGCGHPPLLPNRQNVVFIFLGTVALFCNSPFHKYQILAGMTIFSKRVLGISGEALSQYLVRLLNNDKSIRINAYHQGFQFRQLLPFHRGQHHLGLPAAVAALSV